MKLLMSFDPIMDKLQKHLMKCGVRSTVSENELDFESDFSNIAQFSLKNGVGHVGTLKLENSPIDFIQIIKKQEYANCDFAVGSHVGMGVHKHSWWKMNFFLAFPDSIKIGPFDIGTISTIKKGLFHSEIEKFMWNGYPKLTTLPPGLVRDNVVEPLNQNQRLRQLMIKCLLVERVITISRYESKHKSDAIETNSKIVISPKWKLQKDLFIDYNTIEMYEEMAKIIKQTVNNLKYHLT